MFKASAVVTILSLVGSALGLVTQVLLAGQFGLSIQIDAYMFALAVPIFITSTLGSIINYVAIPQLASLKENNGERQSFIISLLISSAILGTVIIIIGVMALISIQISFLPEESVLKIYRNLESLMNIGWVLGGLQLINYAAVSVLNACKYHVRASFAILLPYLGPVIVLSLYPTGISEYSVIIASIAATVVSIILLIIFIWRKILIRKMYSFNIEEISKLVFASPKAVIAMSCFTSWVVIDSYWTPYIGPGALSTLAYAQRLLIAAGNIAVIGPITTLTPDLAKFAESGTNSKFLNLYFKTQMYIACTATVVAFLIYIFGSFIIELFFSRGAMTSNDARQITTTLNTMLPGMVAMLMSAFAFRAIFCHSKFYTIGAIIGAAWTIQYFILCKVFINKGIQGIALAYDFSWIMSLLFLNLVIITLSKKEIISQEEK